MQDNLFSELQIEKPIKEVLKKLKFYKMTPVQAMAIPEFIKKDVIVQSQTGSGKTLSYLIPILQCIYSYRSSQINIEMESKSTAEGTNDADQANKDENVRPDPKTSQISSLIIVPTRELCNQIQDVLAEFDVSCEIFIGGTKNESNLITKKIDIAIGTPGRLLEVITENLDYFKHLKYLVLDECDKLLSFGFESKLTRISEVLISCSRIKKTTGLFSATLDEEVQKFSQKFLKNPTEIKITENIPDKLSIKFCLLDPTEKIDMLFNLINKKKTIVFFNTCNNVDYFFEMFSRIYKYLDKEAEARKLLTPAVKDDINDQTGLDNLEIEKVDADSKNINKTFVNIFKSFAIYKIHGKMDQRDRNMIYAQFEKTGGTLFCTDVAARGIDFKQIDLIINFDVPKEHSNIVHRSGRTARNGSEGQSILFLMKNEKTLVEFLKLKGIVIEEMNQDHINTNKPDELDKNLDQTEAVENDSIKEISEDYTKLLMRVEGNNNTNGLVLFNLVKKLMDKELLDLSVKGFVSYIRAYKEHILNYILNYKELDFDKLADIHYLEKIPSMVELKNVKFSKYEKPQDNTPVKRKLITLDKATNSECKKSKIGESAKGTVKGQSSSNKMNASNKKNDKGKINERTGNKFSKDKSSSNSSNKKFKAKGTKSGNKNKRK